MPTYAKNKIHIYKWVEKNRELHNERCRNYLRLKYDDAERLKKHNYYIYNKEWKRLLSIDV